jgi:hypothetical protein
MPGRGDRQIASRAVPPSPGWNANGESRLINPKRPDDLFPEGASLDRLPKPLAETEWIDDSESGFAPPTSFG